MRLFFNFLPIALFFITYKFGGGIYQWNGQEYNIQSIYAATAVMIATTMTHASHSWWLHGRIEGYQLIILGLVITLGGATIWLHNPNFIKWKPTIVYWSFAIAIAGAYLFTKQSLLERTMNKYIQLPAIIWFRLSIAWILFFVLSGATNIYIAFNFNEATWVYFKLFGLLGLTATFVIIQSIYLVRYVVEKPNSSSDV
ncbi:MAG: septation protein A [Piscirickettsiaceae bacterium]|nr:septation protein A [Piscirickettsiaceae bacterium]